MAFDRRNVEEIKTEDYECIVVNDEDIGHEALYEIESGFVSVGNIDPNNISINAFAFVVQTDTVVTELHDPPEVVVT